uniref:NR LBD domain-containing protein n=1 Tax=Parastrongyloides trichosuri TaxID=131310 RepID=A0A0N4ZTX2_PARTI
MYYMEAQPNQAEAYMVKEMSLLNYSGSLDYFVVLHNEDLVSLSTDKQFYHVHLNIAQVTEEELEEFISNFKRLSPITKVDNLRNVVDIKRKPGETPTLFSHSLKLLINRVNEINTLTLNEAIRLVIYFSQFTKKITSRSYPLQDCDWSAEMANLSTDRYIGSVDVNVMYIETLKRERVKFYIMEFCDCLITNMHAHLFNIDITSKYNDMITNREKIVDKLQAIKQVVLAFDYNPTFGTTSNISI